MEDKQSKGIEARILFILEQFPKVSPSMLQISLGSGLTTNLWRPVLDDLVRRGELHRYRVAVVTPTGRSQIQTVISLEPPSPDDNVVTAGEDLDHE